MIFLFLIPHSSRSRTISLFSSRIFFFLPHSILNSFLWNTKLFFLFKFLFPFFYSGPLITCRFPFLVLPSYFFSYYFSSMVLFPNLNLILNVTLPWVISFVTVKLPWFSSHNFFSWFLHFPFHFYLPQSFPIFFSLTVFLLLLFQCVFHLTLRVPFQWHFHIFLVFLSFTCFPSQFQFPSGVRGSPNLFQLIVVVRRPRRYYFCLLIFPWRSSFHPIVTSFAATSSLFLANDGTDHPSCGLLGRLHLVVPTFAPTLFKFS